MNACILIIFTTSLPRFLARDIQIKTMRYSLYLLHADIDIEAVKYRISRNFRGNLSMRFLGEVLYA